jgi:Na+/proline symporter
MKRWEAWINHVGWSLTAVSGVLYGVFKYFVANPDPDSRIAHPWQPTLLAVHVLAAPIAIFGFGLLFQRHALVRFFSGQAERRRTGAVMTLLAIPLALSGYVLQVLTGDAARRWTGWVHAAVGLVYAIGYAMHPLSSSPPDDAPEPPADPQGHVP